METENVYVQNGYRDRDHYLKSLADEYGTDRMVVDSIAEILGREEDFDGLICALEDFFLVGSR